MKKLIALCIVSFASMNAAINGIYLLPKNDKGKESIVEIFEKNAKLYAVGFANNDGSINTDVDSKNPNKSLQKRPIRGSVFVEMKCQSDTTCVGKIYSFDRGATYPIKATYANDTLSIKVDTFFGPIFEWKKLTQAQAMRFEDKRLDTANLDTTME